jgi:hypothetical protein
MSSTLLKRARQEQILLSLDKLGMATRSQLQRIHHLGKERNTLYVLNEMKEYLNIKRHPARNGENVYYLNQAGRDLIGSEKEVKYNQTAEHSLLRNDMYIHFGNPADFEAEKEIVFTSGLKQKIIRPDALFTLNGIYHLLEIDNTQSMIKNKQKIQLYSELSPLIKTQFNHDPVLIFFVVTASRKRSISDLCKEKKIHFQIISLEEIK